MIIRMEIHFGFWYFLYLIGEIYSQETNSPQRNEMNDMNGNAKVHFGVQPLAVLGVPLNNMLNPHENQNQHMETTVKSLESTNITTLLTTTTIKPTQEVKRTRKIMKPNYKNMKSRKYFSILLQVCSREYGRMATEYQIVWNMNPVDDKTKKGKSLKSNQNSDVNKPKNGLKPNTMIGTPSLKLKEMNGVQNDRPLAQNSNPNDENRDLLQSNEPENQRKVSKLSKTAPSHIDLKKTGSSGGQEMPSKPNNNDHLKMRFKAAGKMTNNAILGQDNILRGSFDAGTDDSGKFYMDAQHSLKNEPGNLSDKSGLTETKGNQILDGETGADESRGKPREIGKSSVLNKEAQISTEVQHPKKQNMVDVNDKIDSKDPSESVYNNNINTGTTASHGSRDISKDVVNGKYVSKTSSNDKEAPQSNPTRVNYQTSEIPLGEKKENKYVKGQKQQVDKGKDTIIAPGTPETSALTPQSNNEWKSPGNKEEQGYDTTTLKTTTLSNLEKAMEVFKTPGPPSEENQNSKEAILTTEATQEQNNETTGVDENGQPQAAQEYPSENKDKEVNTEPSADDSLTGVEKPEENTANPEGQPGPQAEQASELNTDTLAENKNTEQVDGSLTEESQTNSPDQTGQDNAAGDVTTAVTDNEKEPVLEPEPDSTNVLTTGSPDTDGTSVQDPEIAQNTETKENSQENEATEVQQTNKEEGATAEPPPEQSQDDSNKNLEDTAVQAPSENASDQSPEQVNKPSESENAENATPGVRTDDQNNIETPNDQNGDNIENNQEKTTLPADSLEVNIETNAADSPRKDLQENVEEKSPNNGESLNENNPNNLEGVDTTPAPEGDNLETKLQTDLAEQSQEVETDKANTPPEDSGINNTEPTEAEQNKRKDEQSIGEEIISESKSKLNNATIVDTSKTEYNAKIDTTVRTTTQGSNLEVLKSASEKDKKADLSEILKEKMVNHVEESHPTAHPETIDVMTEQGKSNDSDNNENKKETNVPKRISKDSYNTEKQEKDTLDKESDIKKPKEIVLMKTNPDDETTISSATVKTPEKHAEAAQTLKKTDNENGYMDKKDNIPAAKTLVTPKAQDQHDDADTVLLDKVKEAGITPKQPNAVEKLELNPLEKETEADNKEISSSNQKPITKEEPATIAAPQDIVIDKSEEIKDPETVTIVVKESDTDTKNFDLSGTLNVDNAKIEQAAHSDLGTQVDETPSRKTLLGSSTSNKVLEKNDRSSSDALTPFRTLDNSQGWDLFNMKANNNPAISKDADENSYTSFFANMYRTTTVESTTTTTTTTPPPTKSMRGGQQDKYKWSWF